MYVHSGGRPRKSNNVRPQQENELFNINCDKGARGKRRWNIWADDMKKESLNCVPLIWFVIW